MKRLNGSERPMPIWVKEKNYTACPPKYVWRELLFGPRNQSAYCPEILHASFPGTFSCSFFQCHKIGYLQVVLRKGSTAIRASKCGITENHSGGVAERLVPRSSYFRAASHLEPMKPLQSGKTTCVTSNDCRCWHCSQFISIMNIEGWYKMHKLSVASIESLKIPHAAFFLLVSHVWIILNVLKSLRNTSKNSFGGTSRFWRHWTYREKASAGDIRQTWHIPSDRAECRVFHGNNRDYYRSE